MLISFIIMLKGSSSDLCAFVVLLADLHFANPFSFLQQVERGAFHIAHCWQCLNILLHA